MWIKGKACWAYLNNTNPKSKQHQLDLYDLDDASVKALEAAGISVKKDKKFVEDEDGNPVPNPYFKGRFVTPKAPKGSQPPALFDTKKNRIPNDKVMIGAGSTVAVEIKPYSYTAPDGTKGIGVGLGRVVILDLVPLEKTTNPKNNESSEDIPQFEGDFELDTSNEFKDDEVPEFSSESTTAPWSDSK